MFCVVVLRFCVGRVWFACVVYCCVSLCVLRCFVVVCLNACYV